MHHWIENSAEQSLAIPYVGSVLGGLLPTLLNALFGVLAGALLLALVSLGGRCSAAGRRPAKPLVSDARTPA